jgi:N-methylhydantoinase B
VIDYRVRADGSFFTCAYTRSVHPPWPLDGGREGSRNYAQVLRADGSVEEHAVVTALEVNAGDVIRIRTANGAGYGDPRDRSPELVRQDLRNGFVDEVRAASIHGPGVSLP